MTIYLIEHFVIDRWMPLKMQETCFSKTRAIKCFKELIRSVYGAEAASNKTEAERIIAASTNYPHYRIAEYQSTGSGLRLKIESNEEQENICQTVQTQQ